MSDLNAGGTTTEICDSITLWSDHTHGNGYNPTLEMLIFPDGKRALKLSVFGRVWVTPYTKAECDCGPVFK
jgi:hypothetical protein